MRPCVPFQIERVVEPFPAKRAQISLQIWMALGVAIEQTLKGEFLKEQEVVWNHQRLGNGGEDDAFLSRKAS